MTILLFKIAATLTILAITLFGITHAIKFFSEEMGTDIPESFYVVLAVIIIILGVAGIGSFIASLLFNIWI